MVRIGSGSVNIEDFPEFACSVAQPARLLLKVCSPLQQIVEKEYA